jgi:serine/threonine protein kinase/Flp pilus assembly protein TadD
MADKEKACMPEEKKLEEILAAYLRAVERGEAPDQGELLGRHPELAGELSVFFAEHDQMKRLAGPLRPAESSQGAVERDLVPPTITYHATAPSTTGERYRLKDFHARGGMGEIWLAEDLRINRLVAVKKLRTDRQEWVGRFDAEAQITGQLEHPAIVPVHDFGEDADGRPFYVMKFVRGRTLKEAIRHFYSPHGPKGSDREVEWKRLLAVFVDLCQAAAYAHSRGVVHRDLKPDNVMLGPYGETLVVDWGLAKVLAGVEEPKTADPAPYVRLSSPHGSSETHVGSVFGAPAYMSPEMAEGHAEAADPRTDVYLLGATLYEMLVGKPPHHGSSYDEMVELARTIDPEPPRKLHPHVARPLEAICLKAIAHYPQDRYPGAQDLARDVERFLADEPVSAYRERFSERVLRWMKRRRQALGRIAAAAIVVCAVVCGYAKMQQLQRFEKQEMARQDVKSFRYLKDETQFYIGGTDAPGERVPYYDLKRGEASAERATAALQEWGNLLERLPLPEERDGLKDDLYELLLLRVQARLARESGEPQELLGLLDRAAALAEPSRSLYRLRARVLALLKEHAKATQAAARAEDPTTREVALDHFLKGEDIRTRFVASLQAGSDDAGRQSSPPLLEAAAAYGEALRLDPHHYWSHLQLGRCLLALGREAEAAQTFSTCIALNPEAPWGYSARGLALALAGRYPEAQRELESAMRQHPGFLPARLNYGVALWLQGKEQRLPGTLQQAEAQFHAVLEPSSGGEPLVEAAHCLGQMHLDGGKLGQALQDFTRVIAAKPRFAPAYAFRAQTYFLLGNNDAGLQDLTTLAGFRVGRTLAAESAEAYQQRGRHLFRLAADLQGAAQSRVLELALSQLQKAADLGDRSVALFEHLGLAYHMKATALELRGADREMRECLEKAIQAYSQGIAQPEQDRKQLTDLHVNRGWARSRLGRHREALEDFLEAARRDPARAETRTGISYAKACLGEPATARKQSILALQYGAGDYAVLHNVACAYAELSRAGDAQATEHQDVALALLQRAVELWRKGGAGPNEIDQVRSDPALKPLHGRPEFHGLLNGR